MPTEPCSDFLQVASCFIICASPRTKLLFKVRWSQPSSSLQTKVELYIQNLCEGCFGCVEMHSSASRHTTCCRLPVMSKAPLKSIAMKLVFYESSGESSQPPPTTHSEQK